MCVIKKSERENALFHVRFLSGEIRRRHSLEFFFCIFLFHGAGEGGTQTSLALPSQ